MRPARGRLVVKEYLMPSTPSSTKYPLTTQLAFRWLDRQARLYETFTRQALQEAGLEPGMRVLDVGTGTGAVAALAAEMVGPEGTVLAVDRMPEVLEVARQRRQPNVSFVEGDPAEMHFAEPFDCIVGRFVLVYYPDPVIALRKLASNLRPGGVLMFQEPDCTGVRALHDRPIFTRNDRWIVETIQAAGGDTSIGLRLYEYFVAAGLPAPTLRLDARIGGGPDFEGYAVAAGFTAALLDSMGERGQALAREMELETLEQRMREEAMESGGVVVFPSLIAAWCRRPG
ncbi:MAG TPA: class I SAM-dependent methyltransferase [Terriglobia bacterium]|nr:class I SAM-dependent methyltransferase [Terriglobia bacterium]